MLVCSVAGGSARGLASRARPMFCCLPRRAIQPAGRCVPLAAALLRAASADAGEGAVEWLAKRRINLVPRPNLVLSWLELPAHAFRALVSCRHAGEGLPCCLVTSNGTSSAANGRAGEQYQVKARYQVRANALLVKCV